MTRSRSAPWLGAVALLSAPQLAAAGPLPAEIAWTYSAEVEYDRDYGGRFRVNVLPGGEGRTVPGEISSAWLFSSSGDPRPLPGDRAAQYSFVLWVTLTDVASGDSTRLPFGGWYSSEWSYPEWERDNPNNWRWDAEASDFGSNFSGYGFQLGNATYHVRGIGGGSGQFPNGELLVEAYPISTPEPGTLALAALGLAGVAARRRGGAVAPAPGSAARASSSGRRSTTTRSATRTPPTASGW